MGRPRGSSNILSTDCKHSIMSVYEALGGAEALLKWAKSHQDKYYDLLAKVLPRDVSLDAVITHEDRLSELERTAGLQPERDEVSGHA